MQVIHLANLGSRRHASLHVSFKMQFAEAGDRGYNIDFDLNALQVAYSRCTFCLSFSTSLQVAGGMLQAFAMSTSGGVRHMGTFAYMIIFGAVQIVLAMVGYFPAQGGGCHTVDES